MPAPIDRFIPVTINLQDASIPQVSFGTALVLIDDDLIPLDKRKLFTSRAGYSNFATTSDIYKFSQIYFFQDLVPEKVMIGRWAQSATNPYFYCGSHETSYAVWELVGDGSFTVTDGTNSDIITAVDFDGITALSQVPTILTAAIQAVGAPNVTGLNTSAFEFDSQNRLVLRMSTSGSSAETVSIVSGGGGTDLTTSSYMDVANGAAVAGIDAETPAEALTAIKNLDDSFWEVMCERSATATQLVGLATAAAGFGKHSTLVETSTDAVNDASTTDLGYQIKDGSISRCHTIHHQHTTEWPDAAAIGRFLPEEEGSASIDWNALNGVKESKLAADGVSGTHFNDTEVAALEAKNYSYIVKPGGGPPILKRGRDADGSEHRHVLGADWCAKRIQEAIALMRLKNKSTNFDDATIQQIRAIVEYYFEEGVSRGFLVNTDDRPLTYNFPEGDDFTSQERASTRMSLPNAAIAHLNVAAETIALTMTFTI